MLTFNIVNTKSIGVMPHQDQSACEKWAEIIFYKKGLLWSLPIMKAVW